MHANFFKPWRTEEVLDSSKELPLLYGVIKREGGELLNSHRVLAGNPNQTKENELSSVVISLRFFSQTKTHTFLLCNFKKSEQL